MVARATVTSRNSTVFADVEGSRASVAATVKWAAREGYVFRCVSGHIELTSKGRTLLDFWDSRTRPHEFHAGQLR